MPAERRGPAPVKVVESDDAPGRARVTARAPGPSPANAVIRNGRATRDGCGGTTAIGVAATVGGLRRGVGSTAAAVRMRVTQEQTAAAESPASDGRRADRSAPASTASTA